MKKRFLTAAITSFMLLSCCISISPVKAAGPEGSGTERDPFLITDESQLRMVSAASDAYWRLENDVTLTQKWTPIDTFSGTLDGNGYKISGISITNSENYWPNETAFIIENSGTIKNLHVDGTVNYNSCHPGGAIFVWKNSGTIEECSVQGVMNLTLKNTHTQNSSEAAAFVTFNQENGLIKNCYARVKMSFTVSGGNKSYLGSTSGFVNTNSGSIENCYAASYAVASTISFRGFRASSGTYTSCYYDNDLTGITQESAAYNVNPIATDAMKWSVSYSGWDFDSIWAINNSINDGYPYLQNEKSITISVTGLSLNKTEASVSEDGQLTLTPVFTPANASNKNVSWSTSNRYVATVDNGVVTGVSAGTAVITAVSEDGKFEASCTVTVTEPVPLDYTVNYVTANIPSNGKFRAEVNITKNTDTSDGVIIIALYDSAGSLSDYIFIDGDFDTGKNYTLGGTLTASPGAALKAFVWDSFESMKPISNTASTD